MAKPSAIANGNGKWQSHRESAMDIGDRAMEMGNRVRDIGNG
jgi:hypothetical protein